MKKCPHCHAETFGWRQLVELDYFSGDECRKCKGLVRNDGLRQALTPLAIIGSLGVAFSLSSFVPNSLLPITLPLITILVCLPMVLIPKPVKLESAVKLPPFTPDRNNDKAITISGWTKAELREIVDGFIAESRSGDPACKIVIDKEFADTFRLTFPKDIDPASFAALVNYVVYPIEFVSANRKIVAMGKATLNATFEGIPEELFGQQALLYVPESDQDFDVVYLQSESGTTFADSCDNRWEKVPEARVPPELMASAFGAIGSKRITL